MTDPDTARQLLRASLDDAGGSLAADICQIVNSMDADEHDPRGVAVGILEAMEQYAALAQGNPA